MQEKKDRFRERKPLFALALSFLLIGLGQVYNGKPRKGILFFVASIIGPFLLFQLSVVGPGQTMMALLALALAADLGLFIWAAVDAWKQAKHMEKNYRLKAYNRLSVYIILIIILNLLTYGPFVDWGKMVCFAAPYRMHTGSMAPTILPGDLVMTDERIVHSSENSGLQRGELVVFKYPQNRKVRFIKRIIGLPGDKVELRGTELYVNGTKWTAQKAAVPEWAGNDNAGREPIAFYEKGDSGTDMVFYYKGMARRDFRISVPEGCCFVLGDNRDNSADSRHWGSVPLGDIVARARLVYFSRDPEGGVRWGRMGKGLK
jgi:signal peptidase I